LLLREFFAARRRRERLGRKEKGTRGRTNSGKKMEAHGGGKKKVGNTFCLGAGKHTRSLGTRPRPACGKKKGGGRGRRISSGIKKKISSAEPRRLVGNEGRSKQHNLD